MYKATGGLGTPQRNRNNNPYLLRAMLVKKICKRAKDLQLNVDGKEVGAIW